MTSGTFFLTPAQVRFADEHRAEAGLDANDSDVFFYREDRAWLHRWLVDAEGNVHDQAQFRRHVA
jgi:hypothetical protein